MDLALISNKLQAFWQRMPQKRITQLLFVGLFLYIAFWFANFTWLLIPVNESQKLTTTSISSKDVSTRNNIQISEVKKLNLFGDYNKKEDVIKQNQQIQSAPVTTLRLTLTGLVASDDDSISSAIIESQGKQETYGLDDKITGTRAILKQVFIDRVLISSSGRMETLMLDGFEYTTSVPERNPKNPLKIKGGNKVNNNSSAMSPEKQANIKARVSQARADILENPGKITDYIKISPARKDGVTIGYRLMPNKDPIFFKEVGLVPGDIAVQINGKDLTDMRQAQQALVELRKADHVDLLVERNGEVLDISLGLK